MAQAKVVMPRFFGDGMVLQQNARCRLWGTAVAGKTLTVRPSWNGHGYTTKVDAGGHWAVEVPTPSAGGPYDITLSDGDRLTIRNVLIGEVWICSGQSNMEMPMKGFKAQPVEGADADLLSCRDPRLRSSPSVATPLPSLSTPLSDNGMRLRPLPCGSSVPRPTTSARPCARVSMFP